MRLANASVTMQGNAARAIAFVMALLIAALATLSGLSGNAEETLRDNRDQLRISEASGEIVVLEIDGRSIQALDQWPWPRRFYADAILELNRLGAEQIAFDVDFSSRSSPEQDALFASALKKLGGSVVLPTFRQENRAKEGEDGENVTEALPLPEFREHAFLSAVNVLPNADGRIEFYPYGVSTNDVPRPSIASMVAEEHGRIDQYFRVDQAIDPDTIARISFVDLLEGKVAREQVFGKRIMVGATAIELGDRYPTALFGVRPGVVIQAQAAETLLQNRMRSDSGPWLPLTIAAMALAVMLRSLSRGRSRVAFGAVVIGASVAGIALAFDQFALPYIQLFPIMILLGAFVGLHRLITSALNLRRARRTDGASGLPNRRALEVELADPPNRAIAVARIDDFEQIEAIVSGSDLPRIERKIAKRLSSLAASEQVYRLDRAMFAWFVPKDYADALEEHFASVQSSFAAPFDLDEKRLKIKAFFGSSQGSIADAVTAAEYARRRGIDWSTSALGLQDEAQFQQQILGELDDAMETDAIHVVFQPKMRLSDRAIYGAECLVRWDSLTLGRISPADFIPILETKGQVSDLTKFVLAKALERSREANEAGQPVQLAVNISAQLLSDAAFVDSAIAMMEEAHRKGASGITLEVTESAPLADPELAKITLRRLTDAGARISIDDYGTGQATLNYLQGFPAQEIKLDQSFVRDLVANRADRIMVQSTIDLAHALSFDIVAEGVEDAATIEALAEFGCDYVQGWEIGKPMDWEDFVEFLKSAEAPHTPAAKPAAA